MPALSTARQNVILLAALLASQLFLMSDSAQRNGGTSGLESLVMRVSWPGVSVAKLGAGMHAHGERLLSRPCRSSQFDCVFT